MKERSKMKGQVTRREFIGSAAVVAAYTMIPRHVLGQGASKPNSNFNGVQIGIISYSFRSLPSSADDILNYLVKLGINSVELMSGPIEEFAGAPSMQVARPPRGKKLTPEQRAEMEAARKAQVEELRKWRLSVSMNKFKALRKKYNDEGVAINIAKFGDVGSLTDEEIDYCFNVAKTLGARGITCEISEDTAKRVGPFADRHRIMLGFHNHTQISSQSYDTPLSYAKYNGINLDVGHYVAGTNESPITIIKKYSDRILSLHLKDRKINNGDNVPFGQGDTPVALILQLMKKEKYPFTADIEYEYRTPKGSDVLTEIAKCVEFCKDALA